MDFCSKCFNLMEIKNNLYICNHCNHNIEIKNNKLLFHENLKKNNIISSSKNNLKKFDIYRKKKNKKCSECDNNIYNLYTNENFQSLNICTNCNNNL